MRRLGSAGPPGWGALQACLGEGKGHTWPGVLPAGTATPCRIPPRRDRPAPLTGAWLFQVPAQGRATAPPQAGGQGGVGRDPNRAPGSGSPAELGQVGRRDGPPLHSLQAGPLNLLRCPINRQQPCAQLQRLPPASPLPTGWSRCPGDDRLPHPWAALLRTCPDAARAPGEKPMELQRSPCLGYPHPQRSPCLGCPHWPQNSLWVGCPHWLQKPLWVTVSILASEIVLHGEVFHS